MPSPPRAARAAVAAGGSRRRLFGDVATILLGTLLLVLQVLPPGVTAAAPLKVPPIDPAELDEFASAGFAAPQHAQGAPSVHTPTSQQPQQPRLGFYEVCMLQLLAWFLLNFFWGAAENRKIKDAWLAEFLSFLHEQFAYVGPGCVGGERESAQDPSSSSADPFFQETPDTFRLWASGRRHVQGGMAITLKLRPRHDGIRKLWEFLLSTEDTLLLEASLDATAAPPLVLALARRLHHRSLYLTTPDLFRYATLQPDDATRGLGLDPAAFVVYADAPAGARQVLAGESWGLETVVKHREGFQLLHVSDQNASPVPGHGDVPRVVFRVKLSLPPLFGRRGRARSMAELRPLVEMAFQLLDHLCADKFKLGAQAAAESRAVRREIEAREARFQETLRREEAERRRQERKREALTPQQQWQRELKQEKKDKKKAAAGLLMGRR